MSSDLNTRLLASVSRSFYLSLRFVPGAMRMGLSLGYLLARATDTVADTAKASGDTRLSLLKRMDGIISGKGDDDSARQSLCRQLAQELAPEQEHGGERELLNRFSEVLDMLDGLPESERGVVRKVLATIIRGQVLDLERFDCASGADTVLTDGGVRALPGEEALMEYTYLVAGCVGEFWTELGSMCMNPSYFRDEFSLSAERKSLEEKARHYGQALQMVNILRDRSEDESRGRSYLPPQTSEEEERGLADKYRLLAREWLLEGLDYTEAVRSKRLRFATGLPALIGIRTLELLRDHPDAVRVKVSRSEVYGLLWQACLASFRKGGWADIAAKLRL